jgi:hypothetical protein
MDFRTLRPKCALLAPVCLLVLGAAGNVAADTINVAWNPGGSTVGSLQSGTNVITVTALDAAGNAATATLTVTRSTTTPPSTGGAPTLSVQQRGSSSMRLSWTYTSWSSVDVYRDDLKVKTSSNNGSTNDNVARRGTYTYKVCAPGSTTVCSNSVTISN